jgi:glycosyltransferase involved in cell wall biosynthesis
MPPTIPVSAVLITRDAETHLDRVLESVAVCDEIVVLDSGSTDGTRMVAAAHGARWYEHPFEGYGRQKQRAVALARHDWILSIDGDEVLDQSAVMALTGINWPTADLLSCWRIRRRNFIGTREIRHGHWKTERPVRIFNRLVTGFSDAPVHESVRPTTRVRELPGSMLHYSYRDLSDVIRLDFHRLKALRYRRQSRTAGGAWLALRAVWAGVHSYVLRGGFLEGGAGVIIALAAAVNATLGLALASEPDQVRRPETTSALRPVEGAKMAKSA